jgi:preprotein translocase subunit Sec61beta
MADNLSTPSGMGGLMRFNEEYPSKFRISPQAVIIMIAAVIVGAIVLKIILK